MAGDTVITVIGNLTADPELRFTASGAAVTNFTVASTPRTFNRNSGEWEDGPALFLRCGLWRQPAENVAESLTKGARVIVTGRLRQRSFETKDGDKRTVIELEADEVGPSLRYATATVSKPGRSVGQAPSAEDPPSATNRRSDHPGKGWGPRRPGSHPSPVGVNHERSAQMIVEYVPAMDLRIGDLVVPDNGGSPQRITLHRLEGTPAHAVIQYAEIPGKNICYPAAMTLLVRSDHNNPR